MSYIPYTYSAPKADSRKQFSFTVPSGGARLKGGTLPENTCSYICNFDISGDGISARKTVIKKSGQLDVNGTFHGITKQPFYGRIIFHAGTCLYSYGSTGLSEISGVLPDEKSIMCEFMSKLYIYCKGRVFCVDRDFAVTEQLPDPVLMFENASTSSCRGMKETGTAYNLIAPRVSVTYKGSMPVEAYGGYAYQLPRCADISRPVNVYVDGEEIDAERYRAEETYLHLKSGWGTVLPESLKITFFIKDGEETSFEDFFCGCDLSVSFGGNTNGGTRILMTGNVEKKGYYCRSGVRNPLYFGSDECEIIGDGCENVTAVMKMYGYLIIFTESSVFKMTHNVTSDRIYYSVKEISVLLGFSSANAFINFFKYHEKISPKKFRNTYSYMHMNSK